METQPNYLSSPTTYEEKQRERVDRLAAGYVPTERDLVDVAPGVKFDYEGMVVTEAPNYQRTHFSKWWNELTMDYRMELTAVVKYTYALKCVRIYPSEVL